MKYRCFSRAALLLPIALAGCARYEASPFGLAETRDRIAARSPGDASLAEYARHLQQAGRAAAFDPSDGLTLAEAEVVALFYNPALREVRARANVAHVLVKDAARWDDPELHIDGERITEDVDDRWVLGGTVGLTIPISGRTGVERHRRRAVADAATFGIAVQEQQVLGELRRQWLTWSAKMERATILRDTVGRLDRLGKSADALAGAGELTPLDARAIRIERVLRAAELLDVESEVLQASARLRALLGLRHDAPLALVPSVSLVAPEDLAIDAHPALLQAQADLFATERAFELEVRKQIPDLRIGLGYGVDEGESRVLFNGMIPVPVLNANRLAIAESRATRDAAKIATERAAESLEHELAQARLALEAAERRVQFLQEQLAPITDQQATDAERIGTAGEFNTLLMLDAVGKQADARLLIVTAVLARSVAAADLANFAAATSSTTAPTSMPATWPAGVQEVRP